MNIRILSAAIAAATCLLTFQARADDDRFTLRIGALHADAQTRLSGSGTVAGQTVSFDETLDFGGAELVPRLDGQFRLGERHRLIFDYFRYDKDRRETLGQDLSYDDVTLPAGSYAEARTKIDLASLLYDFALVQNQTHSLGVQLGVEYARLDAHLRAEAGDDAYEAAARENAYAPVVGLRWTVTPGERWRFVAQAQYLDADWGDFGRYDGDISRANAILEYRFTDRFGVFGGYDWHRINIERRGSDGVAAVEQRFKGPVAGLTLAF